MIARASWRARLRVVAVAAGTLAAAVLACLPGLLAERRIVVSAAAVAVFVTAGACVTGWRVWGSAAAASVGVAVLLDAVAMDRGAVSMLLRSLLLLVVIAGIDALELRARRANFEVLSKPPLVQRLGPLLAAIAASSFVASLAAPQVAPSIWLALLGMLAAALALFMAMRRL